MVPFSYNTVIAFLVALAVYTVSSVRSEYTFSYDPASDIGPSKWGSLDAFDDNQCSGYNNSPIDITESKCDAYLDYTFEVSTFGLIWFDFILFACPIKIINCVN